MSNYANNNNYVQSFDGSDFSLDNGVSVIPYQRANVTDRSTPDTKNYGNKFFDSSKLFNGSDGANGYETDKCGKMNRVSTSDKLILTPSNLTEIRRQSIGRTTYLDGLDYGGKIYSQAYIHYINVDSRQRDMIPVNQYVGDLCNLPPYPIYFMNGSSIATVELPGHSYLVGDRISLNNVCSKSLILRNVLSVKRNSLFVRIVQERHGLSLHGLYNPTNSAEFTMIDYVGCLPPSFSECEDIPDGMEQFYILNRNSGIDLSIHLCNVKGSDFTRTRIGNIPINYLNNRHCVYLLFQKQGSNYVPDPDSYLIQLQRRSEINYRDGVSHITDCNCQQTNVIANNTEFIRYNNLFGVPLNHLNSGTPISECTKFPYHCVMNVTENTFMIDVHYPAIVDPMYSFYNQTDQLDLDFDATFLINGNRGGGNQCYTRFVQNTIIGWPSPSFYTIRLDRTYNNVIQARIIASSFPKSQRIINDCCLDTVNNKLYWRNLIDGDHIHTLAIPPGTYSYKDLARILECQFNKTIRCPDSPNVMGFPNASLYDCRGYYKYHLIKVNICRDTDFVSFTSYRKISQQDTPNSPTQCSGCNNCGCCKSCNGCSECNVCHGCNSRVGCRILTIPDFCIEFTQAENLQINFGNTRGGTGIVPQNIAPFDPCNGEQLFIYFTPNTHIRVGRNFPYANCNLYQFCGEISPSAQLNPCICSQPQTAPANGFNVFRAALVSDRALLVNFYRNKGVYPNTASTQEINSVNTSVLLDNFSFNYLTNTVYLPNNNLPIGTLIITDQFINPMSPNQIFVYEITDIIDINNFMVTRYNHGTKYKFVYDSLIINFNLTPENATDAYYWLDQITVATPVTNLPPPHSQNNNTLSFTNIVSTGYNKTIMRVHQPNHQLLPGTIIKIYNSVCINQVPSRAINRKHIINRILDKDNYEVLLEEYQIQPLEEVIPLNRVVIRFPDTFQMLFNRCDTLGHLLGFHHVGHKIAITPYCHIIRNTDPYINDFDYLPVGAQFEPILRRMSLNYREFDYFYIECPELAINYQNTLPVQNVFTSVRWVMDTCNLMIDSFVPAVSIFEEPICNLTELHIAIRHPDGCFVEFNNRNHSFVIEIIEIYNRPDETSVSERIDSEIFVNRVG